MKPTAIVRRFSRTYTNFLGLLEHTILDSPLSLVEVRIFYEIHYNGPLTAQDLIDKLQVDKGYMSRILKKLQKEKWLTARISTEDRRSKVLTLTDSGRKLFLSLDKASEKQISDFLEKLSPFEASRLVTSLGQADSILSRNEERPELSDITIRNEMQPGDVGFILQAHGELYYKEYGYTTKFEKYVVDSLAELVNLPEPNRNKYWICEHNGNRIGFLMLMDRGGTEAQLRYFFIYSEYRGIGLAGHLMKEFFRHIEKEGFQSCYLFTTKELHAATKLYKRHGFQLVEESESDSFGKVVVNQTYKWVNNSL